MDQGDILTLEELYRVTEHDVELPELTRLAGGPRRVTFRPISMSEYLMLFPLDPPEAMGWPQIPDMPEGLTDPAAIEAALKEQRDARRLRVKAEIAWLATLSPDDLQRHQQERVDITYKAIALASLRPSMTVDAAKRLGQDAQIVFQAILVESSIIPRALVTEPPVEPPADAA